MRPQVGLGFPAGERERAAEILYDSLAGVYRPVFGARPKAVRAIAKHLRGDRTITARLEGRVVGVCGISYGKGRFLDLGLWDLFRDFSLAAFRVMLVGSVFEERAAPGELVVESLAVVPELRGQGIGGLLLEAAGAWAKREGLSRVRLYVAFDNQRALRFYLRHHFVVRRFQPLPFPWSRLVGLAGAYELVREL
ncbi:MAG: GCN5-related N-acetyltransferase [Acetothermia bacterium 64_32]|nr:MAG: GCN5-related N-acetyltransferase [Acetothermia bacterium 64_32]HAF71547.1 hypothetical protein [Candidatus Acetothermia bacterium]